jgi:hypothetical protein
MILRICTALLVSSLRITLHLPKTNNQNLTLTEGNDDFLIYLFKGILKNGGDVLKFAGIIS